MGTLSRTTWRCCSEKREKLFTDSHPDKHYGLDQKFWEKRFKLLKPAFETLNNPVRYAKYMDLQRNERKGATFGEIDFEVKRTGN